VPLDKAYLGRKRWGDPDFLYAALDATAYAAFFKESRMMCAGATKMRRKSGGSPHDRISFLHQLHLRLPSHTRWREEPDWEEVSDCERTLCPFLFRPESRPSPGFEGIDQVHPRIRRRGLTSVLRFPPP
jgi:hypothetical protein